MAAPIEFIRRAHEADPQHHVLVHCVQGISRSASVVIFYLMKYELMSLREAFEKTKKCRPIIEPRPEFLDQLGQFECDARGLAEPTLTSAEVYEGKTRLDLDWHSPSSGPASSTGGSAGGQMAPSHSTA